jgi:hypothetical protein
MAREYPVSVAHAAMKFIAAKGLHDEFFQSGALTGHLCDEHCGHPPVPTS